MIHLKQQARSKYYAFFDFISVIAATYFALWFRQNINLPIFIGLLADQLPAGFDNVLAPAVALACVFVGFQYIVGVYDLWNTASAIIWLQRLVPTAAGMTFAAFSYLYTVGNFVFPRSLLFVIFFATVFFCCIWRIAYFKRTLREISEVVLLGRPSDLTALYAQLDTPPYSQHLKVIGFFSTGNPECIAPGIPTMPLHDFESFSIAHPYTSVIVAASDAINQEAFLKILSAARRRVPIYTVPSIYEILLGRIQNLRINDLPLLELKIDPRSQFYSSIKRALDIILALGLLVLSLPILCIIAALIRILSPGGPILFTQQRVGLNGAVFNIFKFRTMTPDAEKNTGAVIAIKDDPRITAIGKFLRKTRLDELPQLWNIVLGDMTFVGPRPERPVFVEKYEKNIPGYKERARVRPGVTGLAQVNGNYESSPETKLKHDLAYIANQSVLLDVQLMFRTIKTVVTRAGQ